MDAEIIIVNDGSTDSTEFFANRLLREDRDRLINIYPNRGKGYAVREGVALAEGKYLIYMDVDLATPLNEIENLLYYLERYDLVIGSRRLDDSNIPVPQSLVRRFTGTCFTKFCHILLGLGFADTQCGFKGFRREAARRLFGELKTHGYCFDVELLYRAKQEGMKVLELPITWFDKGNSKVRIFSDSLKMFIDVIKIRLKR